MSRAALRRIRALSSLSSRTRRVGQPLAATHPHLVAQGELTPGISAAEYAGRRSALAAALPDGVLALFPSAALAYMAHDVPFPFHQSADFHYLCGVAEPSSLLACVKGTGGRTRWHLFVRPSDPAVEAWDGPRAGVDGAAEIFLPEGDAHAISAAGAVLVRELDACGAGGRLLHDAPPNAPLPPMLGPLLEAARQRGFGIGSAAHHVHPLRVRKSAGEAALMRRSARLAAAAFRRVMEGSIGATRRGATEAALASAFEHGVRIGGAERLAYPCVVAGGPNAVALHYMFNNSQLRSGELLLMDAGCSLHGYASDITRTWPLGGRFSAAQRDLYEAVLDVNRRCIAAARADGTTCLSGLHRQSVRWTYENLVALGIVRSGEPGAEGRVQRYYPHAIGHWLGIDVHDTPSVNAGTPLEPSMALTIEPGLYFGEDDERVPAHFRGIGIRIEDDLLLAADGTAEVLTSDAPKDVEAVERLLADGVSRATEQAATSAAPTEPLDLVSAVVC